MQKLPLHPIALILILAATSAFAADAPPTFDVWPGAVPGETGNIGPEKFPDAIPKGVQKVGNVTKPTLTLYRPPKEKDTGAAIVICPGGGYNILAWDLEGTEVASWLNSIGVTGIILKYRVPVRPGVPKELRYLAPLQDAQRSLSLVRSHAAEWGIDSNRIGILGFSAGGNLSAIACTNYDKRAYEPIDDADKLSCRPDFAVLCYPAWLVDDKTDELDPVIRVTPQTPPMFFVHAADDKIKADSSAVLYLALRHAGVSAELHIFAGGGHGFGLRPTTQPAAGTWPGLCEAWLRSRKFLQPAAAAPATPAASVK